MKLSLVLWAIGLADILETKLQGLPCHFSHMSYSMTIADTEKINRQPTKIQNGGN